MPLLGIYLEKTIIWKDTFTPMFTAALFTIAKTWEYPKCPSAQNYVIYIHWQFYVFSSNLDSFLFSCLIPMVVPSNSMVNRSNESGPPCLAPDFSGKAFSLSLLSIMLVVVKNFYKEKRLFQDRVSEGKSTRGKLLRAKLTLHKKKTSTS